MNWLRSLLGLKEREPKPCDCDGCTGRQPNRSKSVYVSHGLHMRVGADGKLHYWHKSRIVE